ncbi:unnamed protein product [Phaeothamnion confervicola]
MDSYQGRLASSACSEGEGFHMLDSGNVIEKKIEKEDDLETPCSSAPTGMASPLGGPHRLSERLSEADKTRALLTLGGPRGFISSALSHGHSFSRTLFALPCKCAACGDTIWGVFSTGCQCLTCSVIVHRQCCGSNNLPCCVGTLQRFDRHIRQYFHDRLLASSPPSPALRSPPPPPTATEDSNASADRAALVLTSPILRGMGGRPAERCMKTMATAGVAGGVVGAAIAGPVGAFVGFKVGAVLGASDGVWQQIEARRKKAVKETAARVPLAAGIDEEAPARKRVEADGAENAAVAVDVWSKIAASLIAAAALSPDPSETAAAAGGTPAATTAERAESVVVAGTGMAAATSRTLGAALPLSASWSLAAEDERQLEASEADEGDEAAFVVGRVLSDEQSLPCRLNQALLQEYRRRHDDGTGASAGAESEAESSCSSPTTSARRALELGESFSFVAAPGREKDSTGGGVAGVRDGGGSDDGDDRSSYGTASAGDGDGGIDFCEDAERGSEANGGDAGSSGDASAGPSRAGESESPVKGRRAGSGGGSNGDGDGRSAADAAEAIVAADSLGRGTDADGLVLGGWVVPARAEPAAAAPAVSSSSSSSIGALLERRDSWVDVHSKQGMDATVPILFGAADATEPLGAEADAAGGVGCSPVSAPLDSCRSQGKSAAAGKGGASAASSISKAAPPPPLSPLAASSSIPGAGAAASAVAAGTDAAVACSGFALPNAAANSNAGSSGIDSEDPIVDAHGYLRELTRAVLIACPRLARSEETCVAVANAVDMFVLSEIYATVFGAVARSQRDKDAAVRRRRRQLAAAEHILAPLSPAAVAAMSAAGRARTCQDKLRCFVRSLEAMCDDAMGPATAGGAAEGDGSTRIAACDGSGGSGCGGSGGGNDNGGGGAGGSSGSGDRGDATVGGDCSGVTKSVRAAGASTDVLLTAMVTHLAAGCLERPYAEAAFVEEFVRGERWMAGAEGYALTSIEAALVVLMNDDMSAGIFGFRGGGGEGGGGGVGGGGGGSGGDSFVGVAHPR